MKIYITFTKKMLFCVFCIIVISICLISRYYEVLGATQENGDTHKKRLDYLSNLGCEIIDEQAQSKKITIPSEFSDVYKTYNKLQKSSGYDLSQFKGEGCIVYTYRVKRFADFSDKDFANANLIVYNGRIIGGDISSSKINGKMYPLKKYEETKT